MAVEFSEPAFLNDVPYWKGLGRTWCSVWSGRLKFVLLLVRSAIKEIKVANDPPMLKLVRVMNKDLYVKYKKWKYRE